jgi:hypothetical protein
LTDIFLLLGAFICLAMRILRDDAVGLRIVAGAAMCTLLLVLLAGTSVREQKRVESGKAKTIYKIERKAIDWRKD